MLNFQKRYSEFGKGAWLCTFDYEYKVDFPPLYSMIDFRNTSNPLFVENGNANLRNVRTHNFFGQLFWQNAFNNIRSIKTVYIPAASLDSYKKEWGSKFKFKEKSEYK